MSMIKKLLTSLKLKEIKNSYIYPSLYYSLKYKIYEIDDLIKFVQECLKHDIDHRKFYKHPICYICAQIGFENKITIVKNISVQDHHNDEFYITFLESIKLKEPESLFIFKNHNPYIILVILQHAYGKEIKYNYEKLFTILKYFCENILIEKGFIEYNKDILNTFCKEEFINFLEIN